MFYSEGESELTVGFDEVLTPRGKESTASHRADVMHERIIARQDELRTTLKVLNKSEKKAAKNSDEVDVPRSRVQAIAEKYAPKLDEEVQPKSGSTTPETKRVLEHYSRRLGVMSSYIDLARDEKTNDVPNIAARKRINAVNENDVESGRLVTLGEKEPQHYQAYTRAASTLLHAAANFPILDEDGAIDEEATQRFIEQLADEMFVDIENLPINVYGGIRESSRIDWRYNPEFLKQEKMRALGLYYATHMAKKAMVDQGFVSDAKDVTVSIPNTDTDRANSGDLVVSYTGADGKRQQMFVAVRNVIATEDEKTGVQVMTPAQVDAQFQPPRQSVSRTVVLRERRQSDIQGDFSDSMDSVLINAELENARKKQKKDQPVTGAILVTLAREAQ